MSTGAGIGAAANIVGGELSGWAALFDQWAMKDAFNQQQAQQAQYKTNAQNIFGQGLEQAGAGAAAQQMQQGQQGRQAGYASVNATPLSVQAAPLGQLQNARNSAYTQLLGGQRARLGSYGDWLQNQWLNNQQTQRGLSQNANFAGGSAATFPIQMYGAQHSMDTLAAIGQAISSIGGSAANYAGLFNSTPQGQQGKYATGVDPGGETSNPNYSNDPAGEQYI